MMLFTTATGVLYAFRLEHSRLYGGLNCTVRSSRVWRLAARVMAFRRFREVRSLCVADFVASAKAYR